MVTIYKLRFYTRVLSLLALAGAVVNDSLVLVDWINRKRREGMQLDETLRTAVGARS